MTRSGILHTLLQNYDHPDVPLSVHIPNCTDDAAVLFVLYLQYGSVCVQRQDYPLYLTLHHVLNYMECPSLFTFSFENEVLNTMDSRDYAINADTTLYHLFDSDGKWISKAPHTVSYPVMRKPKLTRKTPLYRTAAYNTLFCCPRCCRATFFEVLLDIYHDVACIAGGCMQYMFMKAGVHACTAHDTDIFLIGVPQQDMHEIVYTIIGMYHTCFGEYWCIRTSTTVTLFQLKSRHKNTIQIILQPYTSASEVLQTFDLDSSCLLYYRGAFLANARGLRSINLNCNIVDVSRRSLSFEHRLVKYYRKYGIGILVPGYDRCRMVALSPNIRSTPRGLLKLYTLLHRPRPQTPRTRYLSTGHVADAISVSELQASVDKLIHREVAFILRHSENTVFDVYNDENDPGMTASGVFVSETADKHGWYYDAYGVGHWLAEHVSVVAEKQSISHTNRVRVGMSEYLSLGDAS